MDDDKTVIARRVSRVAAGTRLNGIYQIDGLIAIGGMSEIYKGHNIQTMDEVAIKVILPEFANDEQMVLLFRREALTLNRLSHETIIRYHVFSQDQAANLLYLAMEFVNGPTLRESMKQRPLSQLEACTLIRKVAEGMQAAHDEGVIHRDISTDNIILSNNDVSKPKVIDFGIARSIGTSDSTLISSGFAGKYSFVSPEQLGLYGGQVRETSDIYSLGLVFAAALRGRALDMAGSHADVVMKRQTVPDLSMINPGVKPLIERMLQPNPVLRPQSMAEVAAALGPLIPAQRDQTQRGARPARAVVSQPQAGVPPPVKPRRTGAVWLALLALAGASSWYGATRTEAGKAAFASLGARISYAAKPLAKTDPVLVNPKSGKSEMKADDGAPQLPAQTPDPPAEPPQPAAKEAAAQPEPAAQQEQQAAIAPPQELPPAAIAKDEPAKWISAYDGGACFYAAGQGAADGPVTIEGFGDRVEPFEELNRRFKDVYGIEPEIGLRSVTKQQCPAVEFARRAAALNPPLALTLKSDLLKSGQPLEATLSHDGRENAGLYVITPDGLMVNVSAMASRSGGKSAIQIPYEALASKAGDAYLLLAIASDRRLPDFDKGKAKAMAAFFEELLKEPKSGNVSAVVKFVRKR